MAETRDLVIRIGALDRASKTLRRIEQSIGGVQRIAARTTAVLAGVGVGIGAAFAKAVSAAAEEDTQLNRLRLSVEGVGQAWSAAEGGILAFAAAQQRTTEFGDTETFETLRRIVSLTGTYNDALRNTALAQDVATGSGLGANEAARMVAFAYLGAIEPLRRVIPELRSLSAEQIKSLSTAERAQLAIGLLEKRFGGMAAAADPARQGMAELRNNLGDVVEEIGRVLKPQFSVFLRSLNDRLIGLVDIVKKAAPAIRESLGRAFAVVEEAARSLFSAVEESGPAAIQKLIDGFGWIIRNGPSIAAALAGIWITGKVVAFSAAMVEANAALIKIAASVGLTKLAFLGLVGGIAALVGGIILLLPHLSDVDDRLDRLKTRSTEFETATSKIKSALGEALAALPTKSLAELDAMLRKNGDALLGDTAKLRKLNEQMNAVSGSTFTVATAERAGAIAAERAKVEERLRAGQALGQAILVEIDRQKAGTKAAEDAAGAFDRLLAKTKARAAFEPLLAEIDQPGLEGRAALLEAAGFPDPEEIAQRTRALATGVEVAHGLFDRGALSAQQFAAGIKQSGEEALRLRDAGVTLPPVLDDLATKFAEVQAAESMRELAETTRIASEGMEDMADTGVSALQTLKTQGIEAAQQAGMAFGAALGSVFSTLVSGAEDAADAFAATMLRAIGMIAIQMGTMLLLSGIGLFDPVKIGAGLALIALGGVLSGIGASVATPEAGGGAGERRGGELVPAFAGSPGFQGSQAASPRVINVTINAPVSPAAAGRSYQDAIAEADRHR